MYFIESSDKKLIDKAAGIIKEKEPLVKKLIRLPNGDGVIGYGKIIKNVNNYSLRTVTEKAATAILREDLRNIYIELPQMELNENQKVAVLLFVYNIGIDAFINSKVFRFLKKNDYESAANEMLKWDKVVIDGRMRRIPALTERRILEKNLLLSCENSYDSRPEA